MSARWLGWLAAAAILGGCSDGKRKSPAVPNAPLAAPAFWVWHRRSDLTDPERNALRRAGVERLCWQVAECGWHEGRWQSVEISRHLKSDDVPAVVPVFRIKPDAGFLGSPGSAAALARQILAWWDRSEPPAEVQFDFDCPARVLVEYARFLSEMKRQLKPARISITALASWPDAPGFGVLARSVDSLAPMFYDLTSDPPGEARDGRFKPLADPDAARWISRWRDCPAPWFAGLPNFERVSIYQADGSLTGHLRGWEHDALLFHPALAGHEAGPGVVVFRIAQPLTLAGSRALPGQQLVWRTSDGKVLDDLTEAARAAGARGVVYFALPGPGMQAAFSPSHLTSRPDSIAGLEVRMEDDGSLVLENHGPPDLQARALDPGAPGQRGWALELQANTRGAFREAGPGGFIAVNAGGNLPVSETTVLTLRFSRLPADASIRSCPCLAKPAEVRWQVKGRGEPRPLVMPDSTDP
jgi:hypothetical protein